MIDESFQDKNLVKVNNYTKTYSRLVYLNEIFTRILSVKFKKFSKK